MALIKRKNIWHVYYKGPDGRIVRRSTWTGKKLDAEAIEKELMDQNRENKRKARIEHLLGHSKDAPDIQSTLPAVVPKAIIARPKNRVKLSEIATKARNYCEISEDHEQALNRFIAILPKSITYADQVSADIALSYMQDHYGKAKAKTYNNNRAYINTIFNSVLIDAGLPESPFERIKQRLLNDVIHQRPYSDDECCQIIAAAPEPWKTASMISYYTGLRQCDCFAGWWARIWLDLDGTRILRLKPSKTSRFGKCIQAPLHPALWRWLECLPIVNERILGFADTGSHKSGHFTRAFGKILEKCKIYSDERGDAVFNSFRNTFMTRCRNYKVAEHAIRGVSGHEDQEMTDLYSDDIESAKEIMTLPELKI